MAEYKNGVNFRGNMSVEADDTNPEVKTGRVVFVDEDLYESNEAYKAKVDKCVEEGFMRSDEAGSGGSSGGGASGMIVNAVNHPDELSMYLDKTYTEIKTAISNGSPVYVRKEDDDYHADNYFAVTNIYHAVMDGQYSIMAGMDFQFNSETADDYPKYYYGD